MRITRNSPEARLDRFHPIRYFMYRSDEVWEAVLRHLQEMRRQDPKWRLTSVDEMLLSGMLEDLQLPAFGFEGITEERVNAAIESG